MFVIKWIQTNNWTFMLFQSKKYDEKVFKYETEVKMYCLRN